MGRLKGIKNKNSHARPSTSTLSTDEQIRLLANLIIDRILEDQKNEQVLLKKVNSM